MGYIGRGGLDLASLGAPPARTFLVLGDRGVASDCKEEKFRVRFRNWSWGFVNRNGKCN